VSVRPRRTRRTRGDYVADEILLACEKMRVVGTNVGLKFRLVVDLRTITDPAGRELYRGLREAISAAASAAQDAEQAARKVIEWENGQLPQL
jgi:hypothetical protein